MTTHYDAAGNVTGRSVTVRESEWAPGDVAALIASRRAEFVKRGPHGIPVAEATDPANQALFEVDLPVTDFAMQKLQREQDRYYKQYPDAKGDQSLVWSVRRRDA